MRKFLIALTFLTRLPAPIPQNITSEEMGKSSAFFPFIGLILGGILVVTQGTAVAPFIYTIF